MANNISNKLEDTWKKLPNAINGNGQNFIFLLKQLLGDMKDSLDSKFEEISKIANSVTDAPEEMDEQLQNCKIQEVRVGTAISFVLTWDYSNVKNYDSAEIYIKETKGNIADHKNWDEVEVSRTIRTTKTDTVTVEGINAGYIYQITFQAKNTFGSVSRKSGCPVLQYEVSAMNNSPDPPLEFNVYFNKDGVLWTWKQPVNLDAAYAELRTDTNVGNKVGLLEVTQDTKSTVMPPTREGTAYLYNKGYGSKYSTPLSKPWSKPVPSAPQSITATSTYQGLQFTYSQIPEDCQGICISINGKKHYTKDDKFNYYCSTGSYTYKACFYDCFGEGVWTSAKTIATLEEIPPDAVHVTKQTVFDDGIIVGKYIGDHEVVGTKIKEGTITTENLAAGCVTTNELASNSVTTDKIEAGAITTDRIASGAVTAETIGAGAITADKLTSGAVTADKLAANEINMAGALKIVGGNVTLDENGLNVKLDSNGAITFGEGGMTVSDSSGNIYSAIRRVCMGLAKNGNYVRFTPAWETSPSVLVFPQTIVTADTSKANTIQRLHCYADEISNNGFRIHVYEGIDTTDYTTPVNRVILNTTQKIYRPMDYVGPWNLDFSFSIPTGAKEINLVMTVSGTAHYKGTRCICIEADNQEHLYTIYGHSYLTLYADSALIYSSGNFISSFCVDGHSSNRATYQTGVLKINGQTNIHGTLRVQPSVNHPGDDGDDMNFSVSVDYANGYRDTGGTTTMIDSDCNAVFFATDRVSSGYEIQ